VPVLGPAPPDGGHVRPGDEPAEPVAPGVIEFEFAGDEAPAGEAAAMDAVHGVPAGVPLESLPSLPPAAAPLVDWPPDERRRIVALRLVAPQPERFAGRSLRQALAAEGFVLGRFAIFHKPDEEQRAVLSAASLTRPGTFDVETMDSQHIRRPVAVRGAAGAQAPAAGLATNWSSPRATSTSACAGSCRTSRAAP